jgi:hypothetical protein
MKFPGPYGHQCSYRSADNEHLYTHCQYLLLRHVLRRTYITSSYCPVSLAKLLQHSTIYRKSILYNKTIQSTEISTADYSYIRFSLINSYVLRNACKLAQHCSWHLSNVTCLYTSCIYISCCKYSATRLSDSSFYISSAV